MKKNVTTLLVALFLIIGILPFILGSVHRLSSPVPILESNSTIHINEVELNPAGSDTGNQWVEIYNDGPAVDLTGWYITDKDDNKFFFSPGVIGTGGFYVLDGMSGFTHTNENVTLYDAGNVSQDSTGYLTDNGGSGNSGSWQRVPDGTGSFTFMANTKGAANLYVPTVIGNKSVEGNCHFYDDSITLSADVSGFCIQEVIFSVDNGNITNFTGLQVSPGHYEATLPHGTFSSDGNFDWTVYAKDCFNNTASDGIETLNLKDRTTLLVSPSDPNGWNGWYISEPAFSLHNSGTNMWYEWDGDDIFPYGGSFGLEDIPNGAGPTGIESAGILELKWFSDACSIETGNNESINQKTFKIDLTNPEIKDLVPLDNGYVVNNPRPEIRAFLSEVYQGNSGINASSARLLIDGNITVIPNVTKVGEINAQVSYIPGFDMSNRGHSVKLSVLDYSGRYSEKTWSFDLINAEGFDLNVFSPENKTYNTKRILFNITTTNEGNLSEVQRLELMNYNDRRPKWTTLCNNCDNYVRPRNLLEGDNHLVIRATDNYGQVREKNFFVFVDSKKPIIDTVLPMKNKVTNGDLFYIKYSEDNLKKIELFVNNESADVLENCSSGKHEECVTSLDLSSYHGQEIEYWFEVSDSINKVQSKKMKVKVDVISPILILNLPHDETYGKKVPFNMIVSENVSLQYLDLNEVEPRWKKLCTKCDEYGFSKPQTVSFSRGNHSVWIKATDDAGNFDTEPVNFQVDY